MQHLLLLHGAIGSSVQMIPLANALKDRYIIHTPDLPGHGSNAMTESFDMQLLTAFVKDYILSNNLQEACVFGYSMGGYIALLLAKEEPSLVKKIITLATKFHWDEETAAKESRMLDPSVIEEKLPQFAKTLKGRHSQNDWRQLLGHTAVMLEGLGKHNLLKPEDYKAIDKPVMVMLGDRDKMVSLDETVAVSKMMSSSSLAILPQTPHPIEAAPVDLLAFMVTHFLQ